MQKMSAETISKEISRLVNCHNSLLGMYEMFMNDEVLKSFYEDATSDIPLNVDGTDPIVFKMKITINYIKNIADSVSGIQNSNPDVSKSSMFRIGYTVDDGYAWNTYICIFEGKDEDEVTFNFKTWINTQLLSNEFLIEDSIRVDKLEHNKGLIYTSMPKEK